MLVYSIPHGASVIAFFYFGVHAAGDPYHPEELVDVVRWVANEATVDYEDVVGAHHLEDVPGLGVRQRAVKRIRYNRVQQQAPAANIDK